MRHILVVERCACRAYIGLGNLGRQQAALGFLHGTHHRGVAGVILVDTHAKIDLVGVVVGAEGGHQAKDRVGSQRAEILEHGFLQSTGAQQLRLEGVLQQGSPGHGADATGNRSDEGALVLDALEVHIAGEAEA